MDHRCAKLGKEANVVNKVPGAARMGSIDARICYVVVGYAETLNT